MPASQFGGSANRVRRQVTGTMSTGPIPTFFDGTYHPEAAAGSRKPKAQLHPARHGGICTIPRYWCLTLR